MIIFFIRRYNDLDHMAPVIDKISKTTNMSVKIVTSDPFYPLLNDCRIEYLRSQCGISSVNLIDFCLIPKSIKKVFQWLIRSVDPLPKQAGIKNRILRKIQGNFCPYISRKVQAMDIESMIQKITQGSGGKNIFVFDHVFNPFAEKVISFAKSRGDNVVSLPHGINLLDNDLITVKDLSIETPDYMRSFNAYDKVIFPNIYQAQRAVAYGLEEKKMKVLGSARFDAKWTKFLHEKILPQGGCLPQLPNDWLKIVFFLSKEHYNIFQEEVIRCMKYILNFPNVFLIAKLHTRNMQISTSVKSENFMIADNDIHSGELIEWADLSLFNMTSVVMDALRMDKPILCLKNTISNKLIFERFIKTWNVECRDDLRNWIWKFLKDKNTRTYSHEDATRCLAELVDGNSKDVLTGYVYEISSFLEGR